MRSAKIRLVLIAGLVLISGYISFSKDLKLGLDLAGGSKLVFEADMKDVPPESHEEVIGGLRDIIERRVNLLGVSEAVVQTARVGGSFRINAELPGIMDTQEAIDIIGKTAKLEFRDEPPKFINTGVTGADVERARVDFDPNTGKPVVGLKFKPGLPSQKFADLTAKNIGLPLAIFVDEQPVSIATVQTEIKDGNAVIQGTFTLDEVKQLVIQINAGALPAPVQLIEQRTVEASLGAESIRVSVTAGLVGLLMVIVFMVSYYRSLGFLASVALLIYGLVTIAIYKLIPVVLTLPGVAGFILSVGMAVDANILIFERMKEELRRGVPWQDSMELGFGRAWDSIRDANIATIFTSLVLLNPLNFAYLHTSGPVRGFAVTLLLGVLLSLFTGIFVTRTLLRVFARQ